MTAAGTERMGLGEQASCTEAERGHRNRESCLWNKVSHPAKSAHKHTSRHLPPSVGFTSWLVGWFSFFLSSSPKISSNSLFSFLKKDILAILPVRVCVCSFVKKVRKGEKGR